MTGLCSLSAPSPDGGGRFVRCSVGMEDKPAGGRAHAFPDGEIGESHRPETHVIPLAIETALGERSSFEIFGTDYPTPDGTAIRDYVHVSDLAAAHLLSLRYLLEGSRSVALNLGTGRGHSVKQIIAAVARISGRAAPVKEGPRRTGDPSILVVDASEAFKVLTWIPQYGCLDDIVETALNWHRKPL